MIFFNKNQNKMSFYTSEVATGNTCYPQIQTSIHLMFCDIASHGEGMQKIGTICDSGFTNEHLLKYYQNLNSDKVQLYNIKENLPTTLYKIPDCYVLVMKDFFKDQANEFLQILLSNEASDGSNIIGVNWDMERVSGNNIVNNKLGYKLIFCDLINYWKYPFSSYEKRGTIYNSRFMPGLYSFQSMLENQLGYLPIIDATYYYDINECFTPLHQVKDRKKLVGLGLGATLPLQFRWFHGNVSCSDTVSIPIEHGDLYIISQGAAGIQKEKQTKLYLKYGIGFNKSLFE